MEGIAAQHGDKRVADEADNEDHFTEREPEFGFTVPLYREDVDDSAHVSLHVPFKARSTRLLWVSVLRIEHNHNSDDTARRHGIAPVMDDDITCDDLKGNKSCFEDEEIIARCNPEGFIDVAACEADEGRRDGEVGH